MADGASARVSPPAPDGEVSAYFRTRLAPNPHRAAVWKHLCAYLQRWIPADAAVLDLGAGWCDFANTITARRVVAMDLDTTVRRAAAEHVQAEVGDCTDLSRFDARLVRRRVRLQPARTPGAAGDRPAARRGGQGAAARRATDPAATELPAEPRRLLRRLHPCRDLHRPFAGRLPAFGGLADRAGVPAVPAVDDEEQRLRADLPGALVSALPRQTAGRSDAADRHARARTRWTGHVER